MNETNTQKAFPNMGEVFMPRGGQPASSIRCIEVNPQGYRFQRINITYDGEQFFLAERHWQDSLWVPVQGQLAFL